MTELFQDLRFALRTLRKSPGFTLVALLSLALGIGANTAIFTLVDQLILRLLPVRNPQEIVLLAGRGQHYGGNNGRNALSYPMYQDFRDHNAVFNGMMARYSHDPFGGHGLHHRSGGKPGGFRQLFPHARRATHDGTAFYRQ